MSENFAVFQESKQEPLQNAVSVTRMEIPANSQKHVFVKFLPLHYTEEMFRLLGSKFGTLVCLKLIVEPQSGHCMGYGFLQYASEQDAWNAVANIPRYWPQAATRALHAQFAVPPKPQLDVDKTNIRINGLPKDMTRAELDECFGGFGPIVESKLVNSDDTKPSAIGFVRYCDPDHAQAAIGGMNNTLLKDTQTGATFSLRVMLAKATINLAQRQRILTRVLEVRQLTQASPCYGDREPGSQ